MKELTEWYVTFTPQLRRDENLSLSLIVFLGRQSLYLNLLVFDSLQLFFDFLTEHLHLVFIYAGISAEL